MDVAPWWEKYCSSLLPTLQLCMCVWEPWESCLHTQPGPETQFSPLDQQVLQRHSPFSP